MRKIILLSVVMLMSGCAITNETIFEASAGTTGCHPSEMKMIERKGDRFSGMKYWVLECNGQKFMCSVASLNAGVCRPTK